MKKKKALKDVDYCPFCAEFCNKLLMVVGASSCWWWLVDKEGHYTSVRSGSQVGGDNGSLEKAIVHSRFNYFSYISET